MSLVEKVEEALSVLTIKPQDVATIELVRYYAEAIESAQDREDSLFRLGPKMLSALSSLGMTPQSRDALKKGEEGGAGNGPAGALANLRSKHGATARRDGSPSLYTVS